LKLERGWGCVAYDTLLQESWPTDRNPLKHHQVQARKQGIKIVEGDEREKKGEGCMLILEENKSILVSPSGTTQVKFYWKH
jgi:hypothetical protein